MIGVRVFGVEVGVNPFFLLLLFVYASVGLFRETVLVFWVVLLHELAHVAVASCLGVRATRVELLPFGGSVSFSESLLASPVREALIAASGPVHNFAFALFVVVMERCGYVSGNLSEFLVETNVAMGVFNLLPAIPLDGGRLLRAALAPTLGPVRASLLAAGLGRLIGAGVLVIGGALAYLGHCNILVPVLGGFLVFAASREAYMASWARIKDILRKRDRFLAQGAMAVNVLAAHEAAPLGGVARRFVPGKLNLVAVFDDELAMRGLVSEVDVLEAMTKHGPDAPIGTLAP
ncbi:MAG: M50 family metallopeptidase [Firmicutes bacterium]|nr:M50 family metallopeptidase [Bacillota bacterium]MDH7494984.1 M50 family metallopeptidase [Bacillota bacterium]